MSSQNSQVSYLAAKNAKMSLSKKLFEEDQEVSQQLLTAFINYSLTLVDFWADMGHVDMEASALEELHKELIEASHRIGDNQALKNTCTEFANQIHQQWFTINQSRLN
ncbi:MAG: hypothetical protein OXE99_05735 [Cellvibrionales bacterium]|nr:hypothetical protein [Cellvibrionales bacterium]